MFLSIDNTENFIFHFIWACAFMRVDNHLKPKNYIFLYLLTLTIYQMRNFYIKAYPTEFRNLLINSSWNEYNRHDTTQQQKLWTLVVQNYSSIKKNKNVNAFHERGFYFVSLPRLLLPHKVNKARSQMYFRASLIPVVEKESYATSLA